MIMCDSFLPGRSLPRPHPGRADLPVCPDFTARERSEAGGRVDENIMAFVFPTIQAVQQRRPTRGSVKMLPF